MSKKNCFMSFASCVLLTSHALAVNYQVTDLGPVPDGYTSDSAEDVNNLEEVAGYVTGGGPVSRAFRWDAVGEFDVVGTLGGINSFAHAINDFGVIVGRSNTGVGAQTRPFRQEPGGMIESLGTFGGNFGTAWDINNSGIITGVANNASVGRAFIWQEGSGLTDIGNFTPTGASAGLGINSSGKVVGFGTTSDERLHAFFWDGSTFNDLSTIGTGTESMAQAVNDSNVVVGFGTLEEFGSTYGAFRWTEGGGIAQLGQLFTYDTRALDINNAGDIVGWSWIDAVGNSRAVLWEDGGAIVNLNERIIPGSGWLLTSANAINEIGQIVGVGQLDGEPRAFLLTPVPEADAIMLILAACGMGAASRLSRISFHN
ncbi:MAG: hypothetical protein AB7G28_23365 [Pirellulales bacterium]